MNFIFTVLVHFCIIEKIFLYNLTSGVFEPKLVRILNSTVNQLLGVPYADIPLPFSKSNEYTTKSNTSRKADKWGPFCHQPFIFQNSFYGNLKIPHEYEMSIDCLVINLYIPVTRNRTKKSVMFFIHGGSNAAGGSSFMDGTALASLGDVIVAVPNYRLDVLGFLNKRNLTDGKLSGNYGLWDQVTALKWLYNNCDEIGCDKNSITVFGHSAGSADSLILALSKQAQKYIKRIIMQSGSALAHWSYAYENQVLDKILFNETAHYLKALDFKKSKYINAINDTVINFITMTTCNLTHKFSCFKQKIKNFTNIISSGLYKDNAENKFLNFIHNLLLTLDFYEFLNLVGHFQKLLTENTSQNLSKYFMDESDKTLAKLAQDNNANSTYLFNQFFKRNNQKNKYDSDDLHNSTVNKSGCYVELALLITNPTSLETICSFFKNFKTPYNDFFSSKIVKYLLNCFGLYYEKSYQDELHSLVMLNSNLIINELKKCVLLGIEIKKAKGKKDQFSNSTFNYTLREIIFLTENSNHLHKPTTDGLLIENTPHYQIANNEYFKSNIDVMVGITSMESFYFLLHEYSLNDMVSHAFIHSSMLNKTDDLIEKLIQINNDRRLSLCLKRNLVDFYQVKMSDKELDKDALKKRIDALDLMSDFDFNLAFVTQLKYYLDLNSTTNMYVYYYSHESSFNYLIDHMKRFYKDFELTLKRLNYSVTPHFSELDFVFGLPVLSKENLIQAKKDLAYNYTKEEYEFSLSLIKDWSNFAKYGTPKDTNWQKFDSKTRNIYELNAKGKSNNHKMFEKSLKKYQFWYDSLPNDIYHECLKNVNKKKSKFFGLFEWNSSSKISTPTFMIALSFIIIVLLL